MQVFPPAFDHSVLERSDVLKVLSTRLKNKGASQGEKNIDLRKKLEEGKKTVNQVADTIWKTGVSDNQLSVELGTLESNSSEFKA